MHRLFVGLRPPQAVRERLLATMAGVASARWQDDAQLHATLRYIGEVERPVAGDIAAALGTLHVESFETAVAGVGRFDSRGRVSAIWAGLAPREPLSQLHRKIDAALIRIGLLPERRAYLPHITLARLNAAAEPVDRWLANHGSLATPAFAVDHFRLYESHLGKVAARYEMIARYPLA